MTTQPPTPKPPTPHNILKEHRRRSPLALQQFVGMFHLLDARDRTELLLYELQALSQRLAMMATALDRDLGKLHNSLESIEAMLMSRQLNELESRLHAVEAIIRRLDGADSAAAVTRALNARSPV